MNTLPGLGAFSPDVTPSVKVLPYLPFPPAARDLRVPSRLRAARYPPLLGPLQPVAPWRTAGEPARGASIVFPVSPRKVKETESRQSGESGSAGSSPW